MKRGNNSRKHSIDAFCVRRVAVAGLLALSGCASLQDYRVQKGDTLYAISWRYGLDYREVASWNELKPPYVIVPGQYLTLTPPHGQWTLLRKSSDSAPQIEPAAQPPSNPRTQGMVAAAKPKAASQPQHKPASAVTTAIRWQWPATGTISVRTSDARVAGVQIKGRAGQPVRAAADGYVVYSGDSLKGYGNLVIIKHNDQFLSAYAHNRRILVREGQTVSRGQNIAEMGSDAHQQQALYFEIRKDGKPVDPRRYLPASGG